MALITGVIPVFTLYLAIVIADVQLPLPVPLAFRPKKTQEHPPLVCNSTVQLPLPVPLAFRPKKTQEHPAVVCNSTDPPACADKRFGFCVSDDAYPMEHITAAIQDSELVNQFSYKTFPREEIIRLPVKTNKKGRCLSSNVLVKPIRMANVDGNWRVIIQDVKAIIQRERIVLCTSTNDVCQMPGKAFLPLECHTSRCSQKFSVRELLAYDPCESTRGIFVDYFKIPSACSCIFSHLKC